MKQACLHLAGKPTQQGGFFQFVSFLEETFSNLPSHKETSNLAPDAPFFFSFSYISLLKLMFYVFFSNFFIRLKDLLFSSFPRSLNVYIQWSVQLPVFFSIFLCIGLRHFLFKVYPQVFFLSLPLGQEIFYLGTKCSNISCSTKFALRRKSNCNVMVQLTCFVISHITHIKHC